MTYDNRVFCRVSDEELARINELCDTLNTNTSALLRGLLKLPLEVVVDATDYLPDNRFDVIAIHPEEIYQLSQQLRHIGYNWNQAVRALNTIQARQWMTEAHTIEHLGGVKVSMEKCFAGLEEVRKGSALLNDYLTTHGLLLLK